MVSPSNVTIAPLSPITSVPVSPAIVGRVVLMARSEDSIVFGVIVTWALAKSAIVLDAPSLTINESEVSTRIIKSSSLPLLISAAPEPIKLSAPELNLR